MTLEDHIRVIVREELQNAMKNAVPSVSPSPRQGAGLLRVKEAAEHLSVSTDTVRRLLQTGELSAVKVGSRLRISADAIEAYLGRGPSDNAKVIAMKILGR